MLCFVLKDICLRVEWPADHADSSYFEVGRWEIVSVFVPTSVAVCAS